MLDTGELDALLDRYSAAPSRWDTFGNRVR
jgi:hypothetical protein